MASSLIQYYKNIAFDKKLKSYNYVKDALIQKTYALDRKPISAPTKWGFFILYVKYT